MGKNRIKLRTFITVTIALTILLQVSYAGILVLLTNSAPCDIRFASLAEAYFWPEGLAFLEIAAVNVAAYLTREH